MIPFKIFFAESTHDRGVVKKVRNYFESLNDPNFDVQDHWTNEWSNDPQRPDFEATHVNSGLMHHKAVQALHDKLIEHGAKDLEAEEIEDGEDSPFKNAFASTHIKFKDGPFTALATVTSFHDVDNPNHHYSVTSDREDKNVHESVQIGFGQPSWINVKTGAVIEATQPAKYPNHIYNIFTDPKTFGITPEQLVKGEDETRHGWIERLYKHARENGFVQHRNNNFIGHSLEHVRMAVEHYNIKYPHMRGERLKVGTLNPSGDENKKYNVYTIPPEHFQRFLSLGEVHPSSKISHDKWSIG